jgi:hypothetical protein
MRFFRSQLYFDYSGGFGSAPAGNTAFGAPAPAFGSTGGLFGAPAAPAATGFSFGGALSPSYPVYYRV